MLVYMWGGGGAKASVHVYKMASVSVKPEATIVKASFRSFCSIFDQNTLLKTLQTNGKCGQECSVERNGF